MKIVELADVAKTRMDMPGAERVEKQLPISKQDGTPQFSVRVFTLSVNGHTPYHAHPFEHLNYVIKGQGAIVTGSGQERPVQEGDFAMILPDEKHQFKNTSADEPLVIICAVPKEYE